MSLLDGERVRLLAAAIAARAHQVVRFDRGTDDSYRIQLEPVQGDREQLTRAQVTAALPVGSRWSDAVGWESYVICPPRVLGAHDAAVVGIEYVEPHPSRGAFPVFAGAVISLPDVSVVLAALAEALEPEQERVGATYGVVPSRAQSPDEHRKTAAWLLRAASSAYASGRDPLVRTAILTEDEVPRAKALLSPRSLLLGTAPRLCARFSWTSTKILRGLERKA